MYQDGDSEVINGVTYVRQGGQWLPQSSSAPVYGAAPKPDSPPSGYVPAGTDPKPLAAVPGGPADPMRTPAPPEGFRYNKTGQLEPIPGGPKDPNAAGLTPDALNAVTARLILTGQMDPMGMGGGPVRLQILNNRPVMMRQYGVSDQQLPSIQQQFNADSKAYTQRTQQISLMNQAYDAAKQHVDQIKGYLQQLPAQTQFVPLNAVSNEVQRLGSGETITNLDATIPLLKGEIAKIMTANPTSGAGQLTDEARQEFDLLNSARSPQARMEAMDALMEMVNRKITGTQSEADRLNQRLQGGLASYAHLGAPAAPPPGSPPGSAPPGMNGGGPANGGPQDQLTPATGSSKEVLDPNLTPVRREYMARLEAGQTGAQLVSFLRQAGVNDPTLLNAAVQQAQFRQKNPTVPIGAYNTSAIDHITQQMGPLNRAVNALGQTDLGAGMIAAGNSALLNRGAQAVGALGGNEEQARLNEQYSAQDHPGAALTGGLIGGTAAALTGEGLLARAGMAPSFGRSLLADTAYGAASTPDHPVIGGLVGAAGSVVGQGVAKGSAAALRGVTNPAVRAVADEGIPLTVGQTVGQSGRVGQIVKGIEDRVAGFAGAGDMIKARQAEGMQRFNSAAFNKALEPIGSKVGNATGEEAVSKASQAVSDAFSSALAGKSAVPDQEFIQAARGPLERLAANKRVGPEIVSSIEGATQGLFDEKTGALAGEHMQAFLDALRQIREGYRNDPLYQTLIKPSVQGIENAVAGMFERQAPEVGPAFNAAKQAYRRLSVLSDAVNRAKNSEGVFTPGQLGMADRANAKKFNGSISAASGNSPFFDLQRNAQIVLPNKVPDSGTAGRLAMLAVPGSLTGAGAGLGYLGGDTKGGAEAGLGLTGVLALAYTKGGQRRLGQMLMSRSPAARALAEKIMQRVPIAGAAGTALTQTSASR